MRHRYIGGALLAAAAGKKTRVWDASGNLVRELPPQAGTVTDLGWRPGTNNLAVLAYGAATVYDPAAGTDPVKRFEWKGSPLKLAWSPDGNVLAHGNQDSTVHFWYYRSGADLQMYGYATKVRELAWDFTSRFLATGGGPMVCIWDCGGPSGPEDTKPQMLEGHEENLTAVAFQARGYLLASSGLDGRVFLWQPGNKKDPNVGQYRFEGGDTTTSQGVAAANLLEEAILREGPDTVGAFIAEPVQGAGGVIVPQDDYFPRIREICDKYDVLLISDEVITGFGRTGTWFGLQHWGVEPDIMQFAKGITSGYVPLGGIGVSDKIKAAIDSTPPDRRWMHAYTYSGHPTCCAVALANLKIIEEEGLVQCAAEMGNRLLEGLHTLDDMPGVGEVRGLGMMAAVELVADKATKQEFPSTAKMGTRVQREMNQRGLYTRARGDVICLAPPLVTTAEQIDRIVEIVREAIPAAVQGVQG